MESTGSCCSLTQSHVYLLSVDWCLLDPSEYSLHIIYHVRNFGESLYIQSHFDNDKRFNRCVRPIHLGAALRGVLMVAVVSPKAGALNK